MLFQIKQYILDLLDLNLDTSSTLFNIALSIYYISIDYLHLPFFQQTNNII